MVVDASGGGAAPPKFERAITWTRLAGAVAVVAVAPFLPNLGGWSIALLSGSLVVSALALHVLSGRIRTAADAKRFSWITFGWDVSVLSFAMLLMTPDPMWPLVPLIGVIFIITAAFRLGATGALSAAAAMTVALFVIAGWRAEALSLPISPAHVGFDMIMYSLTALIVTSMLREYGALREERVELIRHDLERTRLLEHEREARTSAEITSTRLGAVERISGSALLHDSVDALLDDALTGIVRTLGASAAAIVTPSRDGLIDRATHGLVQRPRAAMRRREEVAPAIEALAVDHIRARTVIPLKVGDHAEPGFLYVGWGREQELDPEERATLELVAKRLGSALHRAERFDAERKARTAAESAVERSQLLLDAADTVLKGADVTERFDQLARLAVPRLADSCAISLLRPDGGLSRVAIAAAPAQRERDMWMIAHRFPRTPDPSDPLWDVMRTGRARRIAHLAPEDLSRLTRGPDHLRLLLERSVGSWIGVPIKSDGTVLGAIELYMGESGRTFSEADLATAELFAVRVAAAATRSRGSDTMT